MIKLELSEKDLGIIVGALARTSGGPIDSYYLFDRLIGVCKYSPVAWHYYNDFYNQMEFSDNGRPQPIPQSTL